MSDDRNQQADNDIQNILHDESQMMTYIREFVCQILQEIADSKVSREKKVNAAKELIEAVAQKEAALAELLLTIKNFANEDIMEWATLLPGKSCQLGSASPTIHIITLTAKTDAGVSEGKLSAYFYSEDELARVTDISEIPDHYIMDLGAPFPPSSILLKNTGDATLYITNVKA